MQAKDFRALLRGREQRGSLDESRASAVGYIVQAATLPVNVHVPSVAHVPVTVVPVTVPLAGVPPFPSFSINEAAVSVPVSVPPPIFVVE